MTGPADPAAGSGASMAQIEDLFNNAPCGYHSLDGDGMIVQVNDTELRWLGYTREEMVGRMRFSDLVTAASLAVFNENFPRFKERGWVNDLELELIRKDGSILPVLLNASAIRDASGRFVASRSTMFDITERRKADDTTRNTQAFLDSIIENLPNMVFVKDARELRFVRLNRAGEELLGIPRQDLLGKNDYDFFPKEEADFFTAKDRQVLADGQALDIPEEPIDTRHRGRRILHTKKVPILDARGRPLYLLGISEDITERRAAAEEIARLHESLRRHAAALESANKELEAFCYSVSHDLRAPLRSIDGFSEALLKDSAAALDAQGRGYLERVRGSARRMGQLIDDLLTLSRLTRSEMRFVRVDLSALARRVAEDLGKSQPERRVDFVIAPDLVAEGDAALLLILLENLLGNAWKFTRNTPRPRIEVGASPQDGGPAFFVADNGAGFDMAYADKLFAAFQRLHHHDEFEGTGIGLATAARIVQRHGGRVWAVGAVGQGATIHFVLGGRRA